MTIRRLSDIEKRDLDQVFKKLLLQYGYNITPPLTEILAQNAKPIGPTGDDVQLHVSASLGDDTNGDGTATKPYLTVNRALDDIDLSGLLSRAVTIEIDGAVEADFSLGASMGVGGSLTLLGKKTDVISMVHLSDEAGADIGTTAFTMTAPIDLPEAFVEGEWLMDLSPSWAEGVVYTAPVISVSGSVVTVLGDWVFSLAGETVTIYRSSGTLSRANVRAAAASPVTLKNLHFVPTASGTMMNCTITGCYYDGNPAGWQPFMYDCYLGDSHVNGAALGGSAYDIFMFGTMGLAWLNFTGSKVFSIARPQSAYIGDMRHKQAVAKKIIVQGPGSLSITASSYQTFHGAGIAISASGGVIIECRSTISVGGGLTTLFSLDTNSVISYVQGGCTGACNGLTVKLDNGAKATGLEARCPTVTSVPVGQDVKVGDAVAQSWASLPASDAGKFCSAT